MRWIYIFLIISLVFISASCQWPGGKATIGTSFVGGNEGLNIKFAADEPPSTGVLDMGSEPFFITIELENKGEDTVLAGDAVALLSGISAFEFGFPGNILEKENQEDILSVRKDGNEILLGGKGEIRYGPVSYLEDAIADIRFNLQADVCYDYKTKAITSLCLKRDAIQIGRTRVGEACEINSIRDIESSGAPVLISNVRETASGLNQVRFTFDITNVGASKKGNKGEVWDMTSIGSSPPCTESLGLGNIGLVKDRIFVTVEPARGLNVMCSTLGGMNSGIVRLGSDNKVSVSCVLDTSNEQPVAFESAVNIYADYAYKETITTGILVKDALAAQPTF